MRISIDVGGTFTDLVLDDGAGCLKMFKAPTTVPDPIEGIFSAIGLAAADAGVTLAALLAGTTTLLHSTTRAINAVVTGRTARTAFLTTEGHPDILLVREGGRTDPFDYRRPYPGPYIPRALTFEIAGRIGAEGEVIRALDEAAAIATITKLRDLKVEAVAVALLWSIVNPAHELRLADLLAQHLPGVPVSLSHQVNPIVREYRRASSTCIDASLKPLMQSYLRDLRLRLRDAGLAGELLTVTSQGAVVSADDLAERPILSLNSGPSMAPVAGRACAAAIGARAAIVTDVGGTTFDVSLVADGVIPWTKETWIGPPYQGHLTGFPSVDVKSIGAGGGSIARVGADGLLRVGPESAGSVPGPVCYGAGGTEPTVTDAAAVLGYIDPSWFLDGRMTLALDAARAAIARAVAGPLGLSVEQAALSILDLATEQMVNAIDDITVKQGIDPEQTVLVGGGGAAGLNAVAIARRLRCGVVAFPESGAALSAAGALLSDMAREFSTIRFMSTRRFDPAAANATIAELEARAAEFLQRNAFAGGTSRIDYAVDARYPSQVWEIDVALRAPRFAESDDGAGLVADMHARHTALFSFADDDDIVEVVAWRARATSGLPDAPSPRLVPEPRAEGVSPRRRMHFHEGPVDAAVRDLDALAAGETVTGPAVIESRYTTVVVPPGASATRDAHGTLLVTP